MKTENLIKAICVLLLICSFGALFSCEKQDEEPDYDENQRIDIITEEVKYTDSFIANAAERYARIATALAESSLDVGLNNNQKELFVTDFKENILPVLYRIKIYESELDAILLSAENYLNDTDTIDVNLLFAFYEIFISTIGSDKSGLLAYELSLHTVDMRAKDANEKYATYGYSWYLEDAERCSELYTKLYELGEEKFVYAISVSSSVTSLVLSKDDEQEESAFTLTDEEFLFILDSQGQHFKSNSLTDSEWKIFGSLVSELIPKRATDLISTLFYSLKNEEYFIRAFQAMPEAVSLYASVSSALKNGGDFSLGADSNKNAASLISALLDCEGDIRLLDTALSEYAECNSERVKEAILAHCSAEEADAFFKEYEPIGVDELIHRLKEANASDSADLLLNNAIISYLCGISPYISYAIFC